MTVEEVTASSDGAVDVELTDGANLDQLGPKSRAALRHAGAAELPHGSHPKHLAEAGATKELRRIERRRFDAYSAG